MFSRSCSICANPEIAWREAIGRTPWLKRQESWQAFHEPEKYAKPYGIDFICCPFCNKRFSLHDKNRWGGSRHLTCGQKINVQKSI